VYPKHHQGQSSASKTTKSGRGCRVRRTRYQYFWCARTPTEHRHRAIRGDLVSALPTEDQVAQHHESPRRHGWGFVFSARAPRADQQQECANAAPPTTTRVSPPSRRTHWGFTLVVLHHHHLALTLRLVAGAVPRARGAKRDKKIQFEATKPLPPREKRPLNDARDHVGPQDSRYDQTGAAESGGASNQTNRPRLAG
jgi:hypothetical protein